MRQDQLRALGRDLEHVPRVKRRRGEVRALGVELVVEVLANRVASLEAVDEGRVDLRLECRLLGVDRGRVVGVLAGVVGGGDPDVCEAWRLGHVVRWGGGR